MKLVKETLFEKFIEDSDPLYDMGIGVKFLENIKDKLVDEFYEIKHKVGGFEFQYPSTNDWGNTSFLHDIIITSRVVNKKNLTFLTFSFTYADKPNTNTSKNYRTKKFRKYVNNIHRKKYAIQCIKKTNIEHIVDIDNAKFSGNYNDYLEFEIYPQYISIFTKYFYQK